MFISPLCPQKKKKSLAKCASFRSCMWAIADFSSPIIFFFAPSWLDLSRKTICFLLKKESFAFLQFTSLWSCDNVLLLFVRSFVVPFSSFCLFSFWTIWKPEMALRQNRIYVYFTSIFFRERTQTYPEKSFFFFVFMMIFTSVSWDCRL